MGLAFSCTKTLISSPPTGTVSIPRAGKIVGIFRREFTGNQLNWKVKYSLRLENPGTLPVKITSIKVLAPNCKGSIVEPVAILRLELLSFDERDTLNVPVGSSTFRLSMDNAKIAELENSKCPPNHDNLLPPNFRKRLIMSGVFIDQSGTNTILLTSLDLKPPVSESEFGNN